MTPTSEAVCWIASLCVAVMIGVAWIRWSAKDRKVNAARRARKKALESCITSWLSEITKTNASTNDLFDRMYKTQVSDFKRLIVGMDKDFWPRQAEFDGLTRRLTGLQPSEFNGQPKPPKEMLSERLQALTVFLNQN